MLEKKSIHELRSIAQGMAIPFAFSDDAVILRQKIDSKNQGMIPAPTYIPPRPEYDARLMLKPPSKFSNEADVKALLQEHMKRGLILTFPAPEQWHMVCGKKEDSGNMRMPLRVLLHVAEQVMR